MFIRPAAVAAALAFFALPSSGASLLVNGSFELDPGVKGKAGSTFANMPTSGGSWDIWSALPGWTTAPGTPGIEIQTARTLGSIDPQDGNYYVELDSTANATMSQSLFLGVGRYLLSFWYSPRTGNAASNGIAFGIDGGTLGTVVDASVSGPDPRQDTTQGTWTEILSEFTVGTAGLYTLTFAATGTSDSLGGLIDNAALTQVPAAVPLPAGGLLLGGALFAAFGFARRKSA